MLKASGADQMYVRSTPGSFVGCWVEFYTRARTPVSTHLFFRDFCYLQTLFLVFLSQKPQKIQMFFSQSHSPLESMNRLAAIRKQCLLDTSKIECLIIVGAAVSRKKIVKNNNGLFQTDLLFRKYSCQFRYFHFKHPKLILADYLMILFTRLALFEIEFYAKICMLIQSIIKQLLINKHGNFACICLYVECVA